MNTTNVTRVELIDHTKCKHCGGAGRTQIGVRGRMMECGACGGTGMPGRSVVFWDANKKVDLDLQDDDRTLKIFISERMENVEI